MTDYEMRKLAKYENECFVESLKSDDELLDLIHPPKFLDVKEAAEYLRIPLGTLYHKIDEIPHEKVGRRLIFTDRGLVRWVKRKTGSKEH
jgi:excisionase family DNA binding protein